MLRYRGCGNGFEAAFQKPAELADSAELARIYAHYIEKTAITFDLETRTPEGFSQLIASRDPRYPFLVAEDDGMVVGYAYASRFRRQGAYDACIELSIYLDAARKGEGIGSALYRTLEDELKAAGITNLYACISCPIVPDEYLDRSSIAFHESMGFTEIGHFHACGCKFGHTYDMVWMEKLIG